MVRGTTPLHRSLVDTDEFEYCQKPQQYRDEIKGMLYA